MIRTYRLSTPREGFLPVTEQVREALRDSGIQSGLCVVYCPHTTAGVTINENADPDVVRDLTLALNKTFPDRPEFRHAEGNSAAHFKALCTGSSVAVPVENGRLLLGTWQGIYFAEFDGPRERRFYVKLLGEPENTDD